MSSLAVALVKINQRLCLASTSLVDSVTCHFNHIFESRKLIKDSCNCVLLQFNHIFYSFTLK